MRCVRIMRRVPAARLGCLLLMGLFGLVGMSRSPYAQESRAPLTVQSVQADGDPVVVEGILLGGTRQFFCCYGTLFATDDACLMPTAIVGSSDPELNLRDYVDLRVRVLGRIVRCPPPPGCACEVKDEEASPSRYGCLIVDAIEEIAACSDPSG